MKCIVSKFGAWCDFKVKIFKCSCLIVVRRKRGSQHRGDEPPKRKTRRMQLCWEEWFSDFLFSHYSKLCSDIITPHKGASVLIKSKKIAWPTKDLKILHLLKKSSEFCELNVFVVWLIFSYGCVYGHKYFSGRFAGLGSMALSRP